MNMIPYLFVARTHGACVNTLNFDACVHATNDNFVACRARCRFLCVHTLSQHTTSCMTSKSKAKTVLVWMAKQNTTIRARCRVDNRWGLNLMARYPLFV